MSTQNIAALLAAADKRNGFPAGTMASVMQQESGGSTKFLDNPSAYHYAAGPDGRRVAGHTGKVSTAFGPFGILESTAADPGYGVKPLGDKSIGEQVRFASDYLAARSKGAGGLIGGLAGYGEGAKYAQQVAARTGGGGAGPAEPIPAAVVAPQPESQPVVVARAGADFGPVADGAHAMVPSLPVGGSEGDTWQAFLRSMDANKRQPVQVNDLRYGEAAPAMQVPQYQFNTAIPQSARPNFAAFGQWGRKA